MLENQSLRVAYNEAEKQFVFTDKRNGKEWKQAPVAAFNPTAFEEKNGVLSYKIQSEGVTFTVEMTLENDAEVVYTINADSDGAITQLNFPTAILAADDKHYILQTDAEGILLPVTDNYYPLEQQPTYSCYGGPCMAWIGMVDGDLKSGYMTIYETPFDSAVLLEKIDGLITFTNVWEASKGTLAYTRKLRTVFFDKGGYVAQCKRYRAYEWVKNEVNTLKARLERFPAMDKMMGAVHMYLWDDARKDEFLKELKESGIEKALVLWDPNHLPYPKPSYSDTAKDLGYAIGMYNLFTDIHPDSDKTREDKAKMPHLLNVYPGQFDYLTAKKKDGTTYSNAYGHYNCPAAIHNEIVKRMDSLQEEYNNEAYLLDVYLANGLYECYDERHPVTRGGYAENIVKNYKFIGDEYNVYLGGELGADFSGSNCSFAHGLMTLHRVWYYDKISREPNNIHNIGNWENNESPSMMVGARVAPQSYLDYCINEYIRVPLYELVHHDATVTSWRWEDGNHHYPELWWKKDLFNVLYGNSPLWSLNQNRFHEYKATFVESYKKIMPTIQKICYDEMLNHRFVSCDHKVQETEFSSGKKVVVNFGDKDYDYNGTIIPKRDFVLFE